MELLFFLFSWIYTQITSFSGDDGADLDLLLGIDKNIQQRSSALFLLKLKEHRRISQVAIDDIVEDWDGLFSHSVQRLHARVREKLASAGIEISSIDGLQEVFEEVPSPFDGLETRHKQEKFYTETLGLVVSGTMQACRHACHTYILYYLHVHRVL